MLQQSFFPSADQSADQIALAQSVRKPAGRRQNLPDSASALSIPIKTEAICQRSQLERLADSQTPVLERFAPSETISILELLADYEAVDRKLADLLKDSKTIADVINAFASEPHACYGEAIRLVGEASLVAKVLAELRSLSPIEIFQQIAQLPKLLREKIWAQFTKQEQQRIAQAVRQRGAS